jgi:hypothetical protein
MGKGLIDRHSYILTIYFQNMKVTLSGHRGFVKRKLKIEGKGERTGFLGHAPLKRGKIRPSGSHILIDTEKVFIYNSVRSMVGSFSQSNHVNSQTFEQELGQDKSSSGLVLIESARHREGVGLAFPVKNRNKPSNF